MTAASRSASARPLARLLRAADRWFRAVGLLTLALLAVTAGALTWGHEAWRPIFALAHLAALVALLPLGAVLVLRAFREAREQAPSAPAGACEVARRYPLVTSLVLLAFVTAGVSLANFEEGERWVRTTANLATVGIVVSLVVRYLRAAGRDAVAR